MKNKVFQRMISLSMFLTLGIVIASQTYAAALNISAAILTKGNCSFINDSATLDFGNLNPFDPKDLTVDTGDQLKFSCNGNGQDDITYSITVSSSANGTASAPRMKHQISANYLPYELSLAPSSGNASKKAELKLVVSGTVRGNDYQYAVTGPYTDTVTVSIVP